jgi:hypothetical protein
MYTPEQINQIMQELDFNPEDASARRTVERLANAKPVSAIDQNFIAQLRSELRHQIAISQSKQTNSSTNNLFAMFLNKTLASALVVLVLVVGVGFWYNQHSAKPLFQNSQTSSTEKLLSGKYAVTGVSKESFGDLGKVAIVPAADVAKLNSAKANSESTVPTTTGAGYGGVAKSSVPQDKMIAPVEQVPGQTLPYPAPTNFVLKYDGAAALPGLSATQGVMKRDKPAQPESLVSKVISFLSFGLIDLSKLQNAKLQNFSFVEDRQYGYGVYVDLDNGIVNMYQNYDQWPQPSQTMEDCRAKDCGASQTKISDLPSDAEAIAAAETFFQQYGISKDGYGTPRVIDAWRIAYEQAPESERANFYIPDQVQVVYPLILDGKEVYDESGNKYGMNVYIDAKTRKVTNIGDIISKQFSRSDYNGETDAKRIVGIAEQGGFRNSVYLDPNGKKVELELDTPTVQMVKIYYSSDNYKTNSDLYMPALVFPIKNWKQTNYWRQTVIVPLVKSILDTEQPQPIPVDIPPVHPLDNVKSAPTTESVVAPDSATKSN